MGKKETPEEIKKTEMAETKQHNSPTFSQTKEAESEDTAFPSELLEAAPDDVKKMITMAMSETHLRGSIPNPVFSKINEKHIHKFLDMMATDDKNEHFFKSTNRFFVLAYTILFLAVFLFLIIFLIKDNKDLLLEIFKVFGAFVAGIGSGFGFKVYLDKKTT